MTLLPSLAVPIQPTVTALLFENNRPSVRFEYPML